MAQSRKDPRGRVLRKGELWRQTDSRYSYSYTDPLGRRKWIYSDDLVTLREKEKKLVRDQLDGLDIYAAGKATVNNTFDRYISASPFTDRLFEKNAYCLPTLPEGVHLLEVKWDEFLPDEIRTALENSRLNATAFSKYYLGMQNIRSSYYFGTRRESSVAGYDN